MAVGRDDRSVQAPPRSVLVERQKEVDEKSRSKTTTVTLRIPVELNEWLDEYRHLSYPQRIDKQALVVEGLRLLYMARGKPGTEAFNLEDVLLSKSAGKNANKKSRQ